MCLFCEIPNERVLYSNSLAYVIRDNFPVTSEHTLIIPKRHAIDYFCLNNDEILACNELIFQLRNEIMFKDKTVSGFNIGINAGEAAGQTIFHCHIHLIPRRIGDIEKPRGGIRNIFPGKGSYNE